MSEFISTLEKRIEWLKEALYHSEDIVRRKQVAIDDLYSDMQDLLIENDQQEKKIESQGKDIESLIERINSLDSLR